MSDQDTGLQHEAWPGSFPEAGTHVQISLSTKRECGAADQVLIGWKVNTREIDDGHCATDAKQNWCY